MPDAADVAKTDAETSPDLKWLTGKSLAALACTIVLAVAMVQLALFVGLRQDDKDGASRWFAFVPSAAGILVGLLLGVLFSAVGKESERFGSALAAINSAFAGATLSDIVRTDSIIRQCFNTMATESGMPNRPILVGLIAVASAIAGFLWMYFFKIIALNQQIYKIDKATADQERDLLKFNSGLAQVPLDIDNPDTVPTDVKEAAKRLTDNPDAETKLGAKDKGKALYLQGRFTEAAEVLKTVLAQTPGDRSTSLYLANSLLAADRPLEAIPTLEQLITDPAAPALARKLLGYAYLFLDPKSQGYQQRLEQSVGLSRDFLALFPQDAGAAVNHACALSQLAAIDKARFWPELLESLRQAKRIDSVYVTQRIGVDLTRPGQDFSPWANDPEFREALGL